MANHLDLEEQEQLDQLKHFWARYGNLVTGVLIVVLAGFAAWNGYQYWQKRTAAQASAMFDEVERVLKSGDVAQGERVFGDMKERFGSSAYAQQSGLALAKLAYESGKTDVAKSSLSWVAASKADPAYAALAKVRLAGVDIESKDFDQAAQLLSSSFPSSFTLLVEDKRGDMLSAQGKMSDAIAAYQKAWAAAEDRLEYRRLIGVKLAALGAPTGVSN